MAAIDHKSAQVSYVLSQLRMASKRLEMINVALTKHGPDAALAAECEGLTARIADLETTLKMLKDEAA